MNKTTDLNWTLVRTWAASQIIKPPPNPKLIMKRFVKIKFLLMEIF